MSRAEELLQKFLDRSETPQESEEFVHLLREDEDPGRALYRRIMLEVDLYESYAGIAQLQLAPPPRRRIWRLSKIPVAAAAAALFLIGLLVLLFAGRSGAAPPPAPLPVAPASPKAPDPVPAPPKPDLRRPTRERSHEDHPEGREHEERSKRESDSKRSEILREFDKEMQEVKRLRERGKNGEADKKQRELESERDRKLKSPELRKYDD